jgi:predicted phage-related endonuclease
MAQLTDKDLLEILELPAELRGQPVDADVEPSADEKLFEEERRTSLGGTDMAAICGFSTYRNLWDVVAERKGILPPFRPTERMRWGTLLEEPVMAEYSRRTGYKLERVRFVRDPERPFLGAHPDRLVVGVQRGVEGKTVEWGREKWSEPGQPLRVPRDYYVQCQHYMGVLRYAAWDLVALFGLSRMRWYELEQNPKVVAALREKAEEVWTRYVVGDELPPIEPSDRAKAWLKLQHPAPKDETIVVANAEQAEAVAKWLEAKKTRERWEREEEKFKLHVQLAIGDATGIVSGLTVVTWRKDRDSTAFVTDWEGLLRRYSERHGFPIDAQDVADFSRKVVTRTGARKLLPKEIKP